MGIISDITSGLVNIITNIFHFDREETIWAKAFFDSEGQGCSNENNENFSIDSNNVQLNSKDIEIQSANEHKFLQTDEGLPIAQVNGLLDSINNLPNGLCDALIKDGWEIRLVDMTSQEFTVAQGYENRTDEISGITRESSRVIEICNLSSCCKEANLYEMTKNVIGHELGHVIDVMFGHLSNSVEWHNAFECDKENFMPTQARFLDDVPDSFKSFFTTFPEEAFAETIGKYVTDGSNFGTTSDTMLIPEMCQYVTNVFDSLSDYFDESKNISFNDFFSKVNPNTDMDTHNFNDYITPKDAPSYKDF